MAAAPIFRRGEVIARRYQVVNKERETALWVGYHACDQGSVSHPTLDQRGEIPEPDVIVKVVRPDLCPDLAVREKLVRDLQRMRGLQHPGMPRLMDVQLLEEHNTIVLIEAIQAGLSQGALLRRIAMFRQKEGFPLAEVRQIGAQLASALSYIHGQMLCHGDLRLESVLLRPDGAKLCDIGLGSALPRSIYLEAVKKVNEFELLSPEVRSGRPPDPRSDVFGLAALYRHLLSIGQGGGWDALLAEKPAMGLVLTRGMHEDPAQRYSSIEALIADVEAVALTGSQIRRRLAPTPLAMAVAAGRLPVEELSRPVEDLVPESARSRRNSGIFEVGAVLAPLSGAPSAKMSIGTIPPQFGGPASARSGRLGEGPSTDSNPPPLGPASASSRGATSATSRGATSSTSKGPISGISRGPTSATSRGPASGISGGERPSSYSLPPVPETSELSKASARSKDGAPTAGPLALSGAKEPTEPHPAPAAHAPIPPPIEPALKSAPPPLGSEDGRGIRRPLGDSASEPRSEAIAKRPPSELIRADGRSDGKHEGKSEGREPSSARSTNSSQRSHGGPASGRSRSGDSVGRQSTATVSLPPNALITSRLALVGALVLAALVGSLITVVVMLLLRPASLLAPIPPPSGPVAPITPPPVEPGPAVPIPVVPIEGPPPSPAPREPVPSVPTSPAAPSAVVPAPAPAVRATPPLRLAGAAATPEATPPSPEPVSPEGPPSPVPLQVVPPRPAGGMTAKPKPAAHPPIRKPQKSPAARKF